VDAQPRQQAVVEEQPAGDDGEVERPDAEDAAQVEPADADGAGAACLVEQQVGDEEARQGEEEADGEQAVEEERAPGGVRQPDAPLVERDVFEDDEKGGEEAQAVEAREVDPPAARRRFSAR
jgi:hypothetical protein